MVCQFVLKKEAQDSNLLSPYEHGDFVSSTDRLKVFLRPDKSQKGFSSKLGLACPGGDLAAWVIKYEWTYKAVFSLTIRRCETVTEQQTHLNEACNQIKVWLRQNIYGRASLLKALWIARKKTICWWCTVCDRLTVHCLAFYMLDIYKIIWKVVWVQIILFFESCEMKWEQLYTIHLFNIISTHQNPISTYFIATQFYVLSTRHGPTTWKVELTCKCTL